MVKPFAELTSLENQVLLAVCEGHGPRAIAATRGVSVFTIRNVVISLRVKFGARRAADLVEIVNSGGRPLPLPPPAPAPLPDPAEIARKGLQAALAFYQSLGPEDKNKRCRRPSCGGGVVKYSVFCRKHDYEMIRREPCPFSGDA